MEIEEYQVPTQQQERLTAEQIQQQQQFPLKLFRYTVEVIGPESTVPDFRLQTLKVVNVTDPLHPMGFSNDAELSHRSPPWASRTHAHENDCVRVGGLRPPNGGRRPPPTRLLASHRDSCGGGRRPPRGGEAPAGSAMSLCWSPQLRQR